ncbi:hypothetical protein TSUD_364940 [Trifolium subterraneum]|uniref:Transposase MuDR plant domain-containing protein n=1 Tax=Trifolium subterraneum TaxID=3900 RepID=A0A2Z6NP27_TRISU|nr:hypothetical protein TSUD_364940 [Trifolium subterraneum]
MMNLRGAHDEHMKMRGAPISEPNLLFNVETCAARGILCAARRYQNTPIFNLQILRGAWKLSARRAVIMNQVMTCHNIVKKRKRTSTVLEESDHDSSELDTENDESDDGTKVHYPPFVMPKKMEGYKWVKGTTFSTREEFKEAISIYVVTNNRDLSSELDTENDESDDGTKVHYPPFVMPKKMEGYKWVKGTTFSTREEFKEAISIYVVTNNRDLRFIKNDKERVRVGCKDGCPFVALLSKVPGEDTWQLRTLNDEHKCMPEYRVKRLNANWLGKKLYVVLERIQTSSLQIFVPKLMKSGELELVGLKHIRLENQLLTWWMGRLKSSIKGCMIMDMKSLDPIQIAHYKYKSNLLNKLFKEMRMDMLLDPCCLVYQTSRRNLTNNVNCQGSGCVGKGDQISVEFVNNLDIKKATCKQKNGTASGTATQTASGTATQDISASQTAFASQTGSGNATQTASASQTGSASQTKTGTASKTQTAIASKRSKTQAGTTSKPKTGIASKAQTASASKSDKPPKPN